MLLWCVQRSYFYEVPATISGQFSEKKKNKWKGTTNSICWLLGEKSHAGEDGYGQWSSSNAFELLLRHQCQQRGRKAAKAFLLTLFCLNSPVPRRYFVVVLQLRIYNYTVSLRNINEPARVSFLNYGSQCLPCLILFNSHKKMRGWEWKHLFNLTSLGVNTFRLGPKLL